MKIDVCREALSVAESRNFQESAFDSYISQASLSRHIRSLEETLGVEIFDRLSHKLQLTPAGNTVMPYLERMVSLYDDMMTDISAMNGSGVDVVNIAYSNTARITGVMREILEIYEERDDTEIKLIPVDDHQVQRLIAQYKLDLGCVSQYEITEPNKLGSIHLMTDRVMALVPPEHPLYERDSLTVQDLRNEHIILYKEHYAVNEMYLSSCRAAGFEADVIVYTTNCSDIGRLVNSGIGIGIQGSSTQHITRNGQEHLRLIPCTGISDLEYYLLYNDKSRKRAVQELVSRLREEKKVSA